MRFTLAIVLCTASLASPSAEAQRVKPVKHAQIRVHAPRARGKRASANQAELVRANVSSSHRKNSLLSVVQTAASQGQKNNRHVYSANFPKQATLDLKLSPRNLKSFTLQIRANRSSKSTILADPTSRSLGLLHLPTRSSEKVAINAQLRNGATGTFYSTIHNLTTGGRMREVGLQLNILADAKLGETMSQLRSFLPDRFNGEIAKLLQSGESGSVVLGNNTFAHFESNRIHLLEFTHETRGWQTPNFTLVAPALAKVPPGPSDN